MFTGRDRPRSSEDGSAHGAPGRVDGQPRGCPDGITSHEEKKHYHDGKLTNSATIHVKGDFCVLTCRAEFYPNDRFLSCPAV